MYYAYIWLNVRGIYSGEILDDDFNHVSWLDDDTITNIKINASRILKNLDDSSQDNVFQLDRGDY